MTAAEPPRKPGRPKIHATASDRVRAHRARAAEKAGKSAAVAGGDEADTATPELAVASLAAVLPALATQAEQFTALVQRVESAIGTVSDPKALDQRLELMRAETARTVSAAEERAAAAEAAAHAATVRADALDAENDELRADAADAWEQTEAAQNAAEQARTDLEEQKAAHQRTLDEFDARQRAEMSALQDNHDSIVASLNTSHRDAIDRYDEKNRRLETELAEVRAEVKTLRTDLATERAAHQDDNRTHAATLAQQRTDATKREAELRRDYTERIDEQKAIAIDLREEISLQRAELERLRGLEEDRRHN
jgi:chromosome segregation ATPase